VARSVPACALTTHHVAVQEWDKLRFLRQAKLARLLAGLLFLLVTTSFSLKAQVPGAPNSPLASAPVLRLERTHHPLATESNAVGRVEGGRALGRMLLVLAPSADQRVQLQQLLEDQHNRQSSNFHHWLTPAEFGVRFGATDNDVQRVVTWLQAEGFTIERVAASKRWIELSGSASQVEKSFHTAMKYYRVNGKTYLGNATDLAVPAEFGGITRGIVSLNNFGKAPPVHEVPGSAGRSAQGIKTKLSANLTAAGSPTTYYMAPGDFAAIYNTKALLTNGIDGTGVGIAVTGQSDVALTDVQQFRQIFGLRANDPNFVITGPDPGMPLPSGSGPATTDYEEALLDVEWAGAVAPGATINLVIAGSTDTTSGVDLAAAYAIENEVAPILTYTYGSCEQALGSAGNAFYNALWQQAAAEGITVLVASGDNGAAGCDTANSGLVGSNGLAVNGVASTPYNVAVGGSEFGDGVQATTYWSGSNAADYSSATGYIPETVWNESCDPSQPASATNCSLSTGNTSLLASAGGISTVYPKPSWQAGPGVPADNARDLPDLALAASTGHDEAVYCTSLTFNPCQINSQQEVVGLTLVGGTSLSTPAMAGILALVEQKNGPLQGQINYVLYKLAQTAANSCDSSAQTNPAAQNSCVFYDITSGSNEVPCAGGSSGCSSTQIGTNGFTTGQIAGPGYDLATGLGSVNAANLVNAWKNFALTPSQTTLQGSSTSFVHGTAITLNGTVAPASGSGSPTGAVSIKTDRYGDSSQNLALTNGGTFSGTISDLPGGEYNLQAYYPGDATFASSISGGLAVNITPEASSTTITVNGLQNGTASYGAPIQLKVAAAGASPNGHPTGTVTINDGANVVTTASLASDGTAYLLTGNGAGYCFAIGTHVLTAAYSGDNSFNASTSATTSFTVSKGTPFVVVGVNTNNLSSGQLLGVHADVAGQGSAPATGTVQFTVDGTPYGTPMALQTGGFFGNFAQAAMLVSGLTQGSHTIGATYNPGADPNYLAVNSGDPNNEINPLPSVSVDSSTTKKTSTTLVANTPPVNLGDTGAFTVTVTPATATGTVTLWDAVGPRTSATSISGGSASIQFSWTQAGSTSLYAVYSGDSANATSTSTPVSFTVQKGTPQLKLVAPSNALATGEVSLNATLTGNPGNALVPYATGVIEFWDSLNGGAAQLLTAQSVTSGPAATSISSARLKLAPGAHTLYVHYRGDTNWQPATSANVSLQASSFALNLSPTNIAFNAGSSVTGTVTATGSGGFTGTVTLMCPSGGTFLPAGYSCTFTPSSSLSLSSATTSATATLNLSYTGSASRAAAVKTASSSQTGAGIWGTAAGASLLLLALFGFSSGDSKHARNFFVACGLILTVAVSVLGCSGGSSGGGGGGGPVSTTTTIVSSNLHAVFGTQVNFTVTVKPNGAATPSGQVQLYDNGQALLSPVNVSAGIASFSASSLAVGVHNLTASYLGDSGTSPSTSAPIMQIITGSVSIQISGSANGITETADMAAMVN
jgi:hypothetical protein